VQYPRFTAEQALYGRWAAFLVFVYQKHDSSGALAITNVPVFPGGAVSPQSPVPTPPLPVALYNDPIGLSLQSLGITPIDPSLIVDNDVFRVPPVRWFNFLDLAEYRLLRSTIGSFTDIEESAQDRSQNWTSLAERASNRADDLEKQYAALLAPVFRPAYSGTIRNLPPTVMLPNFGPGYGRFGPGGSCWGG
jgi:hypothetical protein